MALDARKLAVYEEASRYARGNARLGIQLISANPKRNTEQGGR
jgi:hypothetical protein